MMRTPVWVAVVGITVLVWARDVSAQVVQLPTFQVFSVNTTVMVPDGGTMLLGSNYGYSAGQVSRSVPLLGSIPGVDRGFRNQGVGTEVSAGNVSVTPQIIIMSELEGPVLAEGNRRLSARQNAASPDVRNRASFISRNVGTTRR